MRLAFSRLGAYLSAMPSKSSRPADLLPRWRVYRIRKSAELITTVPAKDEATAVARVIEQYKITDPTLQKRLYARPAG